MAIITSPLSATEVHKAKPAAKPYYLFDGRGLCLQIKPNGNKFWRCRYTRPVTKKPTEISLGQYPAVSLADARKEHQKLLALLAKGIDPRELEQEAENQVKQNDEARFRVVAEKWHNAKKGSVTEKHAKQIWSSLEKNVFPSIGDIPVMHLKAPDLIAALKPIEARGALETLRRIVQRVNEVMDHAINLGLTEVNPLYRVHRVFETPDEVHMPTIRPERLPELVWRVENANLEALTRYLIWWQLLTLVRPVEAAGARWCEIDMDKKLWTVPMERMKKRRIHQVPLSPEMLWILEKLKPMTGHTPFLFTGRVKNDRPMHSQTVNMALRRMGYKGELVSHGFRALGSTAMNEAGFPPDIIEAVLAHVDSNKVRAAYNRSTYLEQRIELMNWWGEKIRNASAGGFWQVKPT
ncbi:integrase domain-containing protein [Salmonella enterica]|uniref:integrase domain-containing protein n=1 Tax=Salmonella enterica TaxID=28901 RepID=UPI003F315CA9|nr:tyrosine-type recombinase/integrase [Salmonella enterica]EHO5103632.1 tyrosine-type recombinase/integrase [Salmonella enterica]EHO5919744.1 tyrosine-type recombinase/integrase [Salmonella enterica]